MQENEQLYLILTIDDFDKSIKRFVKKKSFTQLPKQVRELVEDLEKGNFTGDILTINDNPAYKVYKKRLPNLDADVGTSNGYRGNLHSSSRKRHCGTFRYLSQERRTKLDR